MGVSQAATMAVGNGSNLTGTLFADFVATGGNDLSFNTGNAATHAWEIQSGGAWASDGSETVTITGLALPIWANSTPDDATNNTQNGTFTFTFYGLGADGDVGAGYAGDTLIGTATADFTSARGGSITTASKRANSSGKSGRRNRSRASVVTRFNPLACRQPAFVLRKAVNAMRCGMDWPSRNR